METTLQLWDNTSSDLIEDCFTECEGVDCVVEEVDVYGPDAVHTWALPRDSGTCLIMSIAQGLELARYANDLSNGTVASIPHDE